MPPFFRLGAGIGYSPNCCWIANSARSYHEKALFSTAFALAARQRAIASCAKNYRREVKKLAGFSPFLSA
jgi:hypothetical protein